MVHFEVDKDEKSKRSKKIDSSHLPGMGLIKIYRKGQVTVTFENDSWLRGKNVHYKVCGWSWMAGKNC